MENRIALLPKVKARADKFQIPWKLVDAIITVESAYNPWACRYEKDLNLFQIPEKYSHLNKITLESEIQLQRFSYGLCQLLGVTARSIGYDAALMQLCDVDSNLYWSCVFIMGLMKKYKDIDDVIAAYNMGSPKKDGFGKYINQTYVDKVRKYMEASF